MSHNTTRREPRSRWLWALGLVASLAAYGGTVGCTVGNTDAKTFDTGATDDNRKEEAVPVEVAALGHGEIEAVLRLSSNLEAEREVQVFAEAPRRVTRLLVEEGDAVRKGQQLIQLQDEEQRSAVAKAEIELKESQQDWERTKELHEQKLVTEETFAEAGYTVERNELALADARRELSYTQVRAPIAGVVTERLVNLGDHVTENQALFRIVDFDSIVARIYVPEKDMIRLETGQPARLRADALGGRTFNGSIDRISPVVDPATGTVKVTVATPRQEGLRPGMYVEVELVTAVHEEALLVPKRALVYDNDQMFVFRLRKDENRRVERLRLKPLLENADFIEPAGGVEAGDQLVVAGQSGLKDNGLVRLPGDPEETEDEGEPEPGGRAD
ncbi:MAG: efflux RND transporter periplasmic adaptor subunit [Acidobacteria bacterium]|jgi:membrane fusion protein (multidrug efflux system)|nr:efflux RND transporter periplasmic adaptor subunit [Acidobacteriota bacterium]